MHRFLRCCNYFNCKRGYICSRIIQCYVSTIISMIRDWARTTNCYGNVAAAGTWAARSCQPDTEIMNSNGLDLTTLQNESESNKTLKKVVGDIYSQEYKPVIINCNQDSPVVLNRIKFVATFNTRVTFSKKKNRHRLAELVHLIGRQGFLIY